jgi:hypothetical protein
MLAVAMFGAGAAFGVGAAGALVLLVALITARWAAFSLPTRGGVTGVDAGSASAFVLFAALMAARRAALSALIQ